MRTTVLETALAGTISQLPAVAWVHPTVNGQATPAGEDGRPVNADNYW
ncbi:hypothetical protein AB5J72_42935 [Streptomyces sp. CG1]